MEQEEVCEYLLIALGFIRPILNDKIRRKCGAFINLGGSPEVTVIHRQTPEESLEEDEGEERYRYSGGKSSHRAEGEGKGIYCGDNQHYIPDSEFCNVCRSSNAPGLEVISVKRIQSLDLKQAQKLSPSLIYR